MSLNALLDKFPLHKTAQWELFEKNLLCIKEFQADTYTSLEKELENFRINPYESKEKTITPMETGAGYLNFLIHDKLTGQKYLYHEADPIEETRRIMMEAKLDHPQLVFFLGFGLGYAATQFYNNRPDKNYAMMVVDQDPQVFLCSLLHRDFTDFFSDEDTVLFIGQTLEAMRHHMFGRLTRYLVVSTFIKILPIPMALKLHGTFFQEFLSMTMETRNVAVVSGGNSVDDTFIGFENMVSNRDECLANTGITPLYNIGEGKTIISVASGPSTDAHWDQIKALQGKFPIIVCDSSLKAMLKRGITPDFVTALERVSIVTGFFKDVKIPARTSLVGPPLLLKETLDAFEGTKRLYCPCVNSAHGIGMGFLGILNSGSSAGNLNISFACHMGFTNIIMVGHNLAYDYETKTSHIKGTFDVRQETPYSDEELQSLSGGRTRITQDGSSTVYTQTFWEQFRNQMESLIAQFPERNFVNVAAKGALIEGTKFMSFAEAVDIYKDGACDLFPLQNAIPPISKAMASTGHSNLVARWKILHERVLHWQGVTDKLLKKIEGWEKEITTRETLGRKVSLHYLDDAIDEILKVKVKAVNEDLDFYSGFIGLIGPAHMAFETEINAMPAHYETNYELKRDFLLRHKQYFQIWLKWMPRALQGFESGIA